MDVLQGVLLIVEAMYENGYGFLHYHVKCGMTEEIIVLICSSSLKISSIINNLDMARYNCLLKKFSLKRVSLKLSEKFPSHTHSPFCSLF